MGSVPHYFETALYEMKKIAEYSAENQLNLYERNKLNDEMNQLKDEVASLEKQLVPSQLIHWIKPLQPTVGTWSWLHFPVV